MQKITIGIQPLAALRAEMLAVARSERKADREAPKGNLLTHMIKSKYIGKPQ